MNCEWKIFRPMFWCHYQLVVGHTDLDLEWPVWQVTRDRGRRRPAPVPFLQAALLAHKGSTAHILLPIFNYYVFISTARFLVFSQSAIVNTRKERNDNHVISFHWWYSSYTRKLTWGCGQGVTGGWATLLCLASGLMCDDRWRREGTSDICCDRRNNAMTLMIQSEWAKPVRRILDTWS